MHLKIFKYVFINVLLICFTNISFAQTYPVYKNSSAIAVLDQDALFTESEWGKRVLKNVEKKVSKLSDENRSIETALELEESELTKVRKTISKIEFENKSKIVLLIGSERYGIDSKLLNLADSVYHIEMFGQNSSMNVVQAASIALYETTKILDND